MACVKKHLMSGTTLTYKNTPKERVHLFHNLGNVLDLYLGHDVDHYLVHNPDHNLGHHLDSVTDHNLGRRLKIGCFATGC